MNIRDLKKHRIEMAIGDSSRPRLSNPYLDAEKGKLYATDSFKAVRIPVTLDDGDTSGAVPMKALMLAHKEGAAKILCESERVTAADMTVRRPENGAFPNLDEHFPHGEPVFEIRLDARMLLQTAQALASDGPVHLRFYGELKPIHVQVQGEADAVLMPINPSTWTPQR